MADSTDPAAVAAYQAAVLQIVKNNIVRPFFPSSPVPPRRRLTICPRRQLMPVMVGTFLSCLTCGVVLALTGTYFSCVFPAALSLPLSSLTFLPPGYRYPFLSYLARSPTRHHLSRFPNDRPWMKFMVGALAISAIGDTASNSSWCFQNSSQFFGDVERAIAWKYQCACFPLLFFSRCKGSRMRDDELTPRWQQSRLTSGTPRSSLPPLKVRFFFLIFAPCNF
jgi:hypothetical protein